jgi:hypothetical protein
VKYLAESVVEAQKALRIGVAEFKTGKADFNRVALLQQNLVQQDTLLAQARGDVALGLVQVYRALGGGWEMACTGCPPPTPAAPTPSEPVLPPPTRIEPISNATTQQGLRARLALPRPLP